MSLVSPNEQVNERVIAQHLGALVADGWHFLFDRSNAVGSRIGVLAVGPAGVCVIDDREWREVVSVDRDRLSPNGTSKPSALTTLADNVAAVAQIGGPTIETVGAITFVSRPEFDHLEIDGLHIVGVDRLVEMLAVSPRRHDPVAVEQLHAALARTFPPLGSTPAKPLELEGPKATLGWYLSKTATLYYASHWTSGSLARAYLSDEAGAPFGYRDLLSDAVHRLDAPPDKLADYLMANLTRSGLRADPRWIPKVRTDVPMARVFGHLGRLWRAAVVGDVVVDTDRASLSGTIVHPIHGVTKLGWVDLSTGSVHPNFTEPVLGGAISPERLLEALRDHRPTR